MITRAIRPYLWALGLLWVLPAITFVGGYWLASDDAGDRVLSDKGAVFWIAWTTAPYLFLLGLVAVAIIAMVQRARRHAGSA